MEYNARMYDYPIGKHVTLYKKAITRKEKDTDIKTVNQNTTENEPKKNAHFTKTYKNEERTKEAENHSNHVSLSGTKNRIYNIARSNTWDWFITFTFDRTKTDASDYDMIVYRLKIFLNHLQQRQCPNLKYLIVPELHSDGKHYHFHGLLSDCNGLRFSYSGKDDKKGNPIYNILNWKWGFTTATRVTDTQRVSSYITKYITKESQAFLKEKNRYYCSRNIIRVKPEYTVIDQDTFLEIYGSDITYAKSISVEVAHQQITYFELKD